jgi:hypothetical protein
MEVHHHSHSDSYRDKRKKWTHYFWEFLMLFLAVFCGFLAEYALEHKIESDREKQYARSMIEDLKLDTAGINRLLEIRNRRLKRIDSLSLLLNESIDTAQLSRIYFLSRVVRRVAGTQFVYNDRTIQQLRNAGGLRLIRNQVVSDKITQYDGNVRRIEKIEDVEQESLRELIRYSYNIFDGRIYNTMLSEKDDLFPPAGNPALLPHTKVDMNAYISSLHSVKALHLAWIRFSSALYNDAVALLKTIEQEYNFK